MCVKIRINPLVCMIAADAQMTINEIVLWVSTQLILQSIRPGSTRLQDKPNPDSNLYSLTLNFTFGNELT